jgi:serine/threonine protein kinase
MPNLNEKKKNDNYISQVTSDFVSRLLVKDPKERLASERIKDEVFFMNIDWKKLEDGKEKPAINPKV